MTDEEIQSIMREFLRALEAKDVDKVLSFYADDGDWTTPEGAFKGKDELRRYLKWLSELVQEPKITECGNGIIVQGDRAFIEHMISAGSYFPWWTKGKKTLKVLPLPTWLSASILPPWLSAMSLAIARPRPEPPSALERALSTL